MPDPTLSSAAASVRAFYADAIATAVANIPDRDMPSLRAILGDALHRLTSAAVHADPTFAEAAKTIQTGEDAAHTAWHAQAKATGIV
jgi:hypothetical protein